MRRASRQLNAANNRLSQAIEADEVSRRVSHECIDPASLPQASSSPKEIAVEVVQVHVDEGASAETPTPAEDGAERSSRPTVHGALTRSFSGHL